MAQQTTKEYQVEKILDRRRIGKTILYLVLWKGSSHEDATWQPIYHLSRCERAIRQYQSKQSGNQQKQLKMNCFAKKVFEKSSYLNKIEVQPDISARNKSNEDQGVKQSIQVHSRSRYKKRNAKLTVFVGQKNRENKQKTQKTYKESICKSQHDNTINNPREKERKIRSKKIIYTLNLANNNNKKSIKNKQEHINLEQNDKNCMSKFKLQQMIDQKKSNKFRNNRNQEMEIYRQKEKSMSIHDCQKILRYKEPQQQTEKYIILKQIAEINTEQINNICLAKKTLEPYISMLKRKKEPQFRVDYAQEIQKAIVRLTSIRDREISPFISKYANQLTQKNEDSISSYIISNPSQCISISARLTENRKEKNNILTEKYFD